MKLKQLLVAALLTVSAGASAQTDVTSTYLTNADFSQGTPVTVGVCTYAKDKTSNGTEYANLVAVDGWTAVSSADGKAGGLFAIGGGAWLGGTGFTAPATDSDGNTGVNVLGIVTCWSASVQYTQDLKAALPAGTYTLVLAAYNSGAGQNEVAANLIGFKEAGGTTHYATTKKYTSNTWKYEFITFTLSAETSGQVSIGYTSTNTGSGNMPHLFVSGLQLFEGEVDAEAYEAAKTAAREAKEAKVLWDNAVAAANAALADAAYANVIGVEKAAVEAELAKAEPTTKDAYNEATAALTTATNAFTTAKAAYDGVEAANALAEEYSLTKIVVTAESDATTIAAAIAEINAAVTEAKQAENVSTFNDVKANYPYEIALGAWTTTGKVKDNKGQHWNGDANATYNEPDSWSDATGSATWTQEIKLPAGNYVLQLAGRRSAESSLTASVLDGENVLSTVNDFPVADVGMGIDLDGNANFSTEGTYANDNKGRGFQWRFLPFSLSAETTVKIVVSYEASVTHRWASFTSYVIKAQSQKAVLAGAIADAESKELTANTGTGAFQKNVNVAQTLANQVTSAKAIYENVAATAAEVEQAITDLNAAVAQAVQDYSNAELNAPADGQLFNVVLTFAGWTYDQKAMTFLLGGNPSAGNYAIQYKEAPNTNLAQAFTFTKVEGNKYKMSQIDADGVVRYISTGVPYSGNANQIRTVTEADKALLVEVIPTNVDGVYNLRNTEANNYIGSQDNGVYTVNSHIDFKLVETTKPSIAINTTAAGWGTVMLPFAVASLPAEVKAYSCAEVDGNTLTLVEATALEANKPYIIEGAWNETLSGDAQGTALTATEGLLTGTYAQIAAPVGNYVLQNQSGVVGFYQVEDGTIPNVPANRAYLTKTPSSGVKAFFLGGGEDAIQSVFDGVAAGKIYNVAGQRINKLQRGVNIVNGKKVVIK